MRILVVSDTHGHLHHINRLVSHENADAVIHCGDFGLNSHKEVDHIPIRELGLTVRHHPGIDPQIMKKARKLDRETLISLIQKEQMFGDFDRYLEGSESFDVPVYAVWGNHDDMAIIKKLLKNPIPNLHFLTADSPINIDDTIALFGIGGNFSLARLFMRPYSAPYYPYMSFHEWMMLAKQAKELKSQGKEIWITTHVSPGKEPLLELFGIQIKPRIWFSGHMGTPIPISYSHFTLFEDDMLADRVNIDLKFAKQYLEKAKKDNQEWLGFKKLIDEQDFDSLEDLKLDSNLDKYVTKAITNYFYRKKNDRSLDFEHGFMSETEFEEFENGEYLLNSPLKTKKIDTIDDYFGRRSAEHVKGTWFMNLPDVYKGGHIVIDTENGENGKYYDITTHGALWNE